MVEVRLAVMGLLIVGLHIAGGNYLPVYHRVGEDASLPCNNVTYPNCSSTTWIYNSKVSIPAIEEVAHGVVKNDSGRKDRLSLTSNCSLNVQNVSTEDSGHYTCKQYDRKNGSQKGKDAFVHLSILTMSSFPPVTHLEPDGPVVLSCSLYSYDRSGGCQSSLSLNWVDETGGKLQPESKYQITKTPLCNITLTMTLQKEDINRRFRCQVNDGGGKVETFIDFIPKFSDGSITSTSVVTTPPDTNDGSSATTSAVTIYSNPKDNSSSNMSLTVALVVAGAIVVAAVVCFLPVVILVRKKNAKRQKPTGDNIALTTGIVTNSTGNQPNPNEGPDDGITYATINHSSQKTAPTVITQQEDTVTYASINNCSSRGSEQLSLNVDHSNLYATVTKPQGKKKST